MSWNSFRLPSALRSFSPSFSQFSSWNSFRLPSVLRSFRQYVQECLGFRYHVGCQRWLWRIGSDPSNKNTAVMHAGVAGFGATQLWTVWPHPYSPVGSTETDGHPASSAGPGCWSFPRYRDAPASRGYYVSAIQHEPFLRVLSYWHSHPTRRNN